jgi:hypothetical protein
MAEIDLLASSDVPRWHSRMADSCPGNRHSGINAYGVPETPSMVNAC